MLSCTVLCLCRENRAQRARESVRASSRSETPQPRRLVDSLQVDVNLLAASILSAFPTTFVSPGRSSASRHTSVNLIKRLRLEQRSCVTPLLCGKSCRNTNVPPSDRCAKFILPSLSPPTERGSPAAYCRGFATCYYFTVPSRSSRAAVAQQSRWCMYGRGRGLKTKYNSNKKHF